MPSSWQKSFSTLEGMLYMHADAWLHPRLFLSMPLQKIWASSETSCREDFEWIYRQESPHLETFMHRLVAAVDRIRELEGYKGWPRHLVCAGNADIRLAFHMRSNGHLFFYGFSVGFPSRFHHFPMPFSSIFHGFPHFSYRF